MLKRTISLMIIFAMVANSCTLFMSPTVEEEVVLVEKLKASEDSLYLESGENSIIDLTVTPLQYNESVSVVVKNPEVVDCALGRNTLTITGGEVGSTTITLATKYTSEVIVVNVIQEGSNIDPSVYIMPSETFVTMDASDTKELSARLVGSSSLFGYKWELEDPSLAEMTTIQNKVVITPLKAGASVLHISHPSCEFESDVYLMIEDDVRDNIKYINSSSNIVQMYLDDNNKTLSFSLEHGDDADKANFSYQIENMAIASISSNRDEVIITPEKQGMTRLVVSHPEAELDYAVLIHVISKVFLSYIETSKNYVELSGNRETLSASIHGGYSVNLNEIEWVSQNPDVARIIGHGDEAYLEGGHVDGETIIQVSHPDVQAVTEIYVTNENSTHIGPEDESIFHSSTKYIKVVEGQFAYYNLYREQLSKSVNTIGSVNEGMSCFIENPDIATVEETSDLDNYKILGLESGVTRITFRHEDSEMDEVLTVAVYPEGTDLSTVDTPYLTTSANAVFIGSNDRSKTIGVFLEGGFGNLPPYDEGNPEDYISWTVNSDIVEIIPNGRTVTIKPKKIGECWLEVFHPESSNRLMINVVVEDFISDIINPYITTSQNVLTVVAEGPGRTLNIEGKGIKDPSLYSWVLDDFTVASVTPAGESAIIEGLRTGRTTLSISHPEAKYPLEVIIDVLPVGSVLTDSPYITSQHNILSLVSGDADKEISVYLANGEAADLSDFVWSTDNESLINLTGNNNKAFVSVNDAGSGNITITHPKADLDFTIKVLAYKDQDGTIVDENGNSIDDESGNNGNNVPYISTTQNVVTLVAKGERKTISVSGKGTDESTDLLWSCADDNVLSVTGYDEYAIFQGLTEGETEVLVSHPEAPYPLKILVIVLPEGSLLEDVPYINSSKTIISLLENGGSENISLNLYGGSAADYDDFTWTNSDESAIDLVFNDQYGTITPLSRGSAIITVTHPKAYYSYDIKVIVNSEGYEYDKAPYISTSKNIYTMDKNESFSFDATLSNITAYSSSLFEFEKDSDGIALITSNNTAYVNSLDVAGVFTITITHPDAPMPRTISIIVDSDDPSDLDDPTVIGNFQYISTAKNIIVIEDVESTEKITANLVNGEESENHLFSWSILDTSIASISSEGDEAIITPNSSGQTRVRVSHPDASYDKYITVIVALEGDNVSLDDMIFIENDTQFVSLVEDQLSSEITVNLIGGETGDNSSFSWSIADSDIASVNNNTNKCTLEGKSEGKTVLTISHPKADYSTQIIVNVEKKPVGSSLSLSSDDNIISLTMTDKNIPLEVDIENGNADDIEHVKWTLDNPSIISMTSVGDEAVINPIKEGIATITVTHPLSVNTVEYRVQVSEYFDFSFSRINMTITEGKSDFVDIRYPSYASLPTTIEYSSSDDSIATVTGTNETCEITGVSPGSATITATSNRGDSTELLLRVDRAPADEENELYITCNKSTIDLEEGAEPFSIAAKLEGGSVTDQQGLVWTSTDTSILSVMGTGKSVIMTPGEAGTCEIEITHPLSSNSYVIYVRITGTVYPITLDHTYLEVREGETQPIKAVLDSAPPSAYPKIEHKFSDPTVAEVAGFQYDGTFNIKGLKGGTTIFSARYPGGEWRNCEVEVDAVPYLIYGCTNTVSIEPGDSLEIPYEKNPKDENVVFSISNPAKVSFLVDQVNNKITLFGHDYGTVTLKGEIHGISKSISVKCEDAYRVNASIGSISGNPREVTFSYTCYPSSSVLEVTSSNTDVATVSYDHARKRITVTPAGKLGSGYITLKNKTGVDTVPFDFDSGNINYSFALSRRELKSTDYNDTAPASYLSGSTVYLSITDDISIKMNSSNPYIPFYIHSIDIRDGSGHNNLLTNYVKQAYSATFMNNGHPDQYNRRYKNSVLKYNGTQYTGRAPVKGVPAADLEAYNSKPGEFDLRVNLPIPMLQETIYAYKIDGQPYYSTTGYLGINLTFNNAYVIDVYYIEAGEMKKKTLNVNILEKKKTQYLSATGHDAWKNRVLNELKNHPYVY